jgi:hypothetical protein
MIINSLLNLEIGLNLENKMKALKYVENLIKLCDLYNSFTTI